MQSIESGEGMAGTSRKDSPCAKVPTPVSMRSTTPPRFAERAVLHSNLIPCASSSLPLKLMVQVCRRM